MRRPSAGLFRTADAVGAGLVAALAGWAALVSGGDDGRMRSFSVLLAGLVAAVAVGRWLADRGVQVVAVVATAVLSTVVLTYPAIRAAAGAPTGYANANATFAGVGALAAISAARAAAPGRSRQSWVLAAGLLGGAVALTGSLGGMAALAAATALLGAAAATGRPGVVSTFGLVLVVGVLGLTTTAAVDDDSRLDGADDVRVELWHAGVELARERPITGSGVGVFEQRNPVTTDGDLRWVHHEYVELALEVGAVGLLLALAVTVWAAFRLWLAASGTGSLRAADHSAEGAAAAATLVALHGTVDHVWHAPAPIVLAALLVGAATVSSGHTTGHFTLGGKG